MLRLFQACCNGRGRMPQRMYFKRNHFGENSSLVSHATYHFFLPMGALHSPRWSLPTQDQLVSEPWWGTWTKLVIIAQCMGTSSISWILMSLNTWAKRAHPNPLWRWFPLVAILKMEARIVGFSNESWQWLQPLASGIRGRPGAQEQAIPWVSPPWPGRAEVCFPAAQGGTVGISISKEESEHGVCFGI